MLRLRITDVNAVLQPVTPSDSAAIARLCGLLLRRSLQACARAGLMQ